MFGDSRCEADPDYSAPLTRLKVHFGNKNMAGSVNKVILVGNLGRDPEIRAMQNGDRVANLRIATSETWRDQASGERKEKTEWHQVVIWNQNLVKLAEQYLRKGSKIYVEGSLQTRKWTDQQGVEKYNTEVVLTRFKGELTMLDGRRDGAGGGMGDGDDMGEPMAPRPSGGGMGAGGMRSGGGGGGRSTARDLDDDIPF